MNTREPSAARAARVRSRMVSAGRPANSENGIAGAPGASRVALIASLRLAALDGLAAGEATLEAVPVGDLGLGELPAQEDQPVAVQRVEVGEPAVQVLEHAAAGVHGADAAPDALLQRLAAALQRLELDRIGVAGAGV